MSEHIHTLYTLHTLSGILGKPIKVKSRSRLSTVPPPSSVNEPIPMASALPDCTHTHTLTSVICIRLQDFIVEDSQGEGHSQECAS